MSNHIETAKTVLAKLNGTATVTNLITGIYTHVPQDAAYPYANLLNIEFNTDDNSESKHFVGTFNLHTWSQARDFSTIADIQKAIYDALHFQPLNMTGYVNIELQQEFNTIEQDPDGLTYHGVQRFRILLQEG